MGHVVCTFLIALLLVSTSLTKRSFVVDHKENCFRKDGLKFQFISGSMHYYRIPRPYWKDRLLKLKGAGFNTVQTYIPWNQHEPVKGRIDFSGRKDLFSYLKLCSDLGILVLLRPGPFIAAEFEFGGFPSWLPTQSKTISFRTSETVYLKNVLTWFSELLPMLAPYLYQQGGPVIGLQMDILKPLQSAFDHIVECNAMDDLDFRSDMSQMIVNLNDKFNDFIATRLNILKF
ncbi:beta-galactosidase-like [Bolinopsis microptera]|uniref:beta-galactosidase-like n=1 Tax=Bolinopsis microptera TaxID=2820187 RepID=UPI003078FFBC